MKRWTILILLSVAAGLGIRYLLFEAIYIASPSMEPTLGVGDHFFVDKISFIFRSPKRGEIIVLAPPVEKEGKELVKRVIGLPGDTIQIKNKLVSINGQPLDEPYTVFKRKDEILVGDNIPEMPIPEDEYFVMGDNRDESGDSRDWKYPNGDNVYFVNKESIKGRLLNVLP